MFDKEFDYSTLVYSIYKKSKLWSMSVLLRELKIIKR